MLPRKQIYKEHRRRSKQHLSNRLQIEGDIGIGPIQAEKDMEKNSGGGGGKGEGQSHKTGGDKMT